MDRQCDCKERKIERRMNLIGDKFDAMQKANGIFKKD
jgi:hypothetical protein